MSTEEALQKSLNEIATRWQDLHTAIGRVENGYEGFALLTAEIDSLWSAVKNGSDWHVRDSAARLAAISIMIMESDGDHSLVGPFVRLRRDRDTIERDEDEQVQVPTTEPAWKPASGQRIVTRDTAEIGTLTPSPRKDMKWVVVLDDDKGQVTFSDDAALLACVHPLD